MPVKRIPQIVPPLPPAKHNTPHKISPSAGVPVALHAKLRAFMASRSKAAREKCNFYTNSLAPCRGHDFEGSNIDEAEVPSPEMLSTCSSNQCTSESKTILAHLTSDLQRMVLACKGLGSSRRRVGSWPTHHPQTHTWP